MTSAILLSGGMDSTALAWWKRPQHAITINYGQRAARAEIEASRALANTLSMRHQIIELDCSQLGSGDLTGTRASALAPSSEWWPYRNQLLVTLAAMACVRADAGVSELLVGCVASDAAHKDGSARFIELLNAVVSFQEGDLRVSAPASGMTTVDLIRRSRLPMSALRWAHSCHKSDVPCMNCRGCNKYCSVLEELGSAS